MILQPKKYDSTANNDLSTKTCRAATRAVERPGKLMFLGQRQVWSTPNKSNIYKNKKTYLKAARWYGDSLSLSN